MNRSKAKGTAAETAVVRFLVERGWPYAERAALTGSVDSGDVTGVPGLAWEVRARRDLRLGAWLLDAEDRAAARRADFGLLVVKPQGLGSGRVHHWPAMLPLAEMVRLLHAAGYGDPAGVLR